MTDDPHPTPDDQLAELSLDVELAESERLLDDEGVRSSLLELLSAPEGLASRTTAHVGDALLTRSTLATAVDLVTVGWHTLRLLAGDPVRGQEVTR
jgi:hypothetical protein